MNGLSEIFKSSGGRFEVSRFIGAVGGISYIVGAHAFIAWNMTKGHEFDLIAYCTAFPGGLGLVVGSTAGAVALRDRQVAEAKKTEASIGIVPEQGKADA